MPKKEDFGYTLVRGKDKVLQKFKKILLCCPSFVVANSKKQRGSNNLFSRDPIANEFIKLDNEIRIDKDNKEVKKFKKIVLSFVKNLCHLIEYENSALKFTVFLVGSFPLNVKISKLDEFDFVLLWENLSKCYDIRELEESDLLQQNLDTVRTVIKSALINCQCNINLFEIKLFQKRHAMSIYFSWLCPLKHKHSLSLDLAICSKASTTVKEYFDSRKPLRGTPFETLFDEKKNVYWSWCLHDVWLLDISSHKKPQAYLGRVNTNYFDKLLFEAMDNINSNIKLCFRILKFVRDCYFPSIFNTYYDHLSGEEEVFMPKEFPSYILKQVLFRELIKFPNHKHWKSNLIPARIASMLEKVLNGDSYPVNFVSPSEVNSNLSLEAALSILNIQWGGHTRYSFTDLFDTDMEVDFPFQLYNPVVPALESIILSLRSFARNIYIKNKKKENGNDGTLTIALKSKIVVTVRRSLLESRPFPNLACYDTLIKLNSFEDKLLKNYAFCRIFQAYYEIVSKMDHVDISLCNECDEAKILVLLNHSVITKADTDSKNYIKKLSAFKELLNSYKFDFGLQSVQHSLFDLQFLFGISIDTKNFHWRVYRYYRKLKKLFQRVSCNQRASVFMFIDELEKNLRWGKYNLYLLKRSYSDIEQYQSKLINIIVESFYSCKYYEGNIVSHLWLLFL